MNNTKENTISIIELTQKSYSSYKQAFHCMKCRQEEKAQFYYHQGDELLLQVSKIHAKMLSEDIEMDLLIIHAEDLLISVQLYKSMIKELLVFYT